MSIKEVQKTEEYPEKVRKISTFEGFYELFSQYYATAKTMSEAFDLANAEHIRLFGRRAYMDYDSFRGAIRRHLKNKRT